MFDITQTITPANILLNEKSKANEQRLKVIEKNVKFFLSNKPQLLVPVELAIPKIGHLYNYLLTMCKKVFGNSNMNLGELNGWCLDHEELPPVTIPDLPFVVKFQIFNDDADFSTQES